MTVASPGRTSLRVVATARGAASAHARRDFMRTKGGPGIRLLLRLDLALKLALGPSESFFMLKTEYSAFSGARAGLSRLFGLFS